ncbi:MAG: protein kinase, partial [Polyangiaceae bacterium]
TTVKMLRGKVAYMSPEHITGQEVDCRSDVWSMGVVLWEMITGERLFRRETEIDVMRAVALKPVAHPRRRNEHAPHGLSRIALCALNRDPDSRYQSAAAMAAELEAYAASTGVATHSSAVRGFLMDAFPEGEQRKLELLARFKGVQSSGMFPRSSEHAPGKAPPPGMPRLPGDSEPPAAEPTVAERRRQRSEPPAPEPTVSEPPPTLPDMDDDDEPTAVLIPARSNPPAQRSVPPLPLVRRKQRSKRRNVAIWSAALALPLLSLCLVYLAERQAPRLTELHYQESERSQEDMHSLELPVVRAPQASGVHRPAQSGPAASPSPPTSAETKVGVQRQHAKTPITAERRGNTRASSAPLQAPQRFAGTGDLVVTGSSPGIPIYRNGDFLGVTPLRVRLPHGVQHLEARYGDGRKANLSTQIQPGALSLLTLPE